MAETWMPEPDSLNKAVEAVRETVDGLMDLLGVGYGTIPAGFFNDPKNMTDVMTLLSTRCLQAFHEAEEERLSSAVHSV